MKRAPACLPVYDMKNGLLDKVHTAWVFGAPNAREMARETGANIAVVHQCVHWLKKANWDVEKARALRSSYVLERQMKRALALLQSVAPVAETEQPPRPPAALTIQSYAEQLIRAKETNEEVLAAVRERFPHAGTTANSIRWYRNQMIASGENVPSSVEARRLVRLKREADK